MACVKATRATNKEIQLLKSSILKTTKKDPNLSTAKEILKHVNTLQKFLHEHKFAYLNVINYLSTNKTMTEADREYLDNTAQKVLNECNMLLKEFKQDITKGKKHKQLTEHYVGVAELVESYLRTISKMYTEVKATRAKKVIDVHKLSRLENISTTRNIKEIPPKILDETESKQSIENNHIDPKITETSTPAISDGDQLSSEEIQMFESENALLYNELNSLSDEVQQMEKKVVHISELQALFTEKVLVQDKDIDRIATTVTGTTENIKAANEQIRQAIQRNAGLRVWVLFFLLVMSFSLLFLDWYND